MTLPNDKKTRPRILIIKPTLPYPPNQGTKVVTFELIKALSVSYDVTVLAKVRGRDELAFASELEKWCLRVVSLVAPNRKSIVHRVVYKPYYILKSLIMRRPMSSLYACPGAFMHAARRLSHERFDLTIIEYWQLGPLIRSFAQQRHVLLTHDIDTQINREMACVRGSYWSRIVSLYRSRLEHRAELGAYQSAGRVWTLTERDKQAVMRLTGHDTPVDVLPVPIKDVSNIGLETERRYGEVLFMGHLQAAFNQDALEYFIDDIYPSLCSIDGLTVTIVGGALPKALTAFGRNANVEVVGRVTNVEPYLRRAACLVVPLRFAGGLRIRILEAMFAALPVVCTPVAIAGMPFEDGTDYLAADTPDEFFRQVQHVLGDVEFAAKLAHRAFATVHRHYGARSQSRRVLQLVSDLIDPA